MDVTNYKLILCDHHTEVHKTLIPLLNAENISISSVYNGKEALQLFHEGNYQMIILETMLPDLSGMEVCQEIREFSQIPILFLSDRTREFDRVLGLEMGADDYVCKPYSAREVVLRIKKLLSRCHPVCPTNSISFHELTVDMDSMAVLIRGERIETTPKEVQLLWYFAGNPGKVLTREQILKAVWGYDYYGDTRSVDSVVKRIRKKLPEDIHFEIRSVYSVGYQLCMRG